MNKNKVKDKSVSLKMFDERMAEFEAEAKKVFLSAMSSGRFEANEDSFVAKAAIIYTARQVHMLSDFGQAVLNEIQKQNP